MNLRELIEHADKSAVEIFRKSGRLLPMYHIVQRDGVHTIMPMPNLSKDVAVAVMRAALEVLDAVAVVFIDEAWAITRGPEWRENNLKKQVKDEPDRVELIIYAAESETEPSLHATRLIDAKTRELGPLEITKPQAVSGRMTGLLPVRGEAN